MDLDLERFWAVVRPKRHPPRPRPAKKPKPIRVYIEGVESAHGAYCTDLVEMTLSEVPGGYQGEARFGVVNSEVTLTGFRWYARPGGPSSFMGCEPRHLGPGEFLVLHLNVESDGPTLPQLRNMGLLD